MNHLMNGLRQEEEPKIRKITRSRARDYKYGRRWYNMVRFCDGSISVSNAFYRSTWKKDIADWAAVLDLFEYHHPQAKLLVRNPLVHMSDVKTADGMKGLFGMKTIHVREETLGGYYWVSWQTYRQAFPWSVDAVQEAKNASLVLSALK